MRLRNEVKVCLGNARLVRRDVRWFPTIDGGVCGAVTYLNFCDLPEQVTIYEDGATAEGDRPSLNISTMVAGQSADDTLQEDWRALMEREPSGLFTSTCHLAEDPYNIPWPLDEAAPVGE